MNWIITQMEDFALSNPYDHQPVASLFHDHLPISSNLPLRSGYVCPLRLRGAFGDKVVQSKTNDGFKVNLDVQQFRPEEIKVQVVDNFLVVEAKHEERQDQHGFISRQFTRRYKLTEDLDTKALTSKLSSDGILTLEAPKKKSPEAKTIEIPIIHTNQPAVKESTNTKQSK